MIGGWGGGVRTDAARTSADPPGACLARYGRFVTIWCAWVGSRAECSTALTPRRRQAVFEQRMATLGYATDGADTSTAAMVGTTAAVRWLMRGKAIQAWGGPCKGPSYNKGEDWIPTSPQRPHPTLCRVHQRPFGLQHGRRGGPDQLLLIPLSRDGTTTSTPKGLAPPSGTAACGAFERSLQVEIVDRGRVRRFLAAHPRTRQILSVTMGMPNRVG